MCARCWGCRWCMVRASDTHSRDQRFDPSRDGHMVKTSSYTNRFRLWRTPTTLITHGDMGLTRAAITHPPRRGADGTMTLTQPWTVRRDGSRDTIRRQRAERGRHPDLTPTLDGDGADGAQDTHGALQIWTTTASFCPQGQNGAVVNAFDSTFRHHGFDSYGLTHGKTRWQQRYDAKTASEVISH